MGNIQIDPECAIEQAGRLFGKIENGILFVKTDDACRRMMLDEHHRRKIRVKIIAEYKKNVGCIGYQQRASFENILCIHFDQRG